MSPNFGHDILGFTPTIRECKMSQIFFQIPCFLWFCPFSKKIGLLAARFGTRNFTRALGYAKRPLSDAADTAGACIRLFHSILGIYCHPGVYYSSFTGMYSKGATHEKQPVSLEKSSVSFLFADLDPIFRTFADHWSYQRGWRNSSPHTPLALGLKPKVHDYFWYR